MFTTTRGALVALAAATLFATGCTESPGPATPSATTPARTPSAASPPAVASPPASASTTPSASPTPSRAPTATGGGPVSSATPPAGYAQSCAKDVPWGRQVSKPFICLEAPAPGARVARGGTVTVRGYAGGSFESNVVNEVRALIDREPGVQLAMKPVTYTAPDIGMPGAWTVTLAIPVSAPVGAARVIAHFDSPRDGSVVAQATVDIVVD